MKADPGTTLRRPPNAGALVVDRPASIGEVVAVSKTQAEALRGLDGEGVRFVATAPGRLDVMGGTAEFAGALVLGVPLGHHVCVAVQGGRGGVVRVTEVVSKSDSRSLEFPVARFVHAAGNGAATVQPKDWIRASLSDEITALIGALVEGVHAGLLAIPADGLSISLASTLRNVHGGGRTSAVAGATLSACMSLCDRSPQPALMAAVCHRVENNWLGTATGPAGGACALSAEAGALQQVQTEPFALAGSLPLSDGFTLLAVDCGVLRPDVEERFKSVRTAALMGRLLIERIVRHEGSKAFKWDGLLARLSVSDFVDYFRDRIPTKIKGSEFLERFGETGDTLTRIDPSATYKVRSRTEHQLYEHARSRQFVECLSRGAQSEDRVALLEAGEAMNASHWSYGQRCGLGSIETDLLVNLIRRHGSEAGIYGAKATARGCGGLVAVLMERSVSAASALAAAVEDYSNRKGHTARILGGSIPGALISGVARL